MVNGALNGIRVLDVSRVLAGPWAGQLLADYGADVIKIERPGCGDDTRSWGPPWLRDADGNETDQSAYFLAANRNKRSVTLNLAHVDGQQILRELALKSDILIENFKVGTMRRFDLDAGTLRRENPGLIYCSVSAFGQTGSRSAEPGYDAMIQGAAGLMSITGPAADEGGGPQKVGVAVADLMAGMYAATAILAALAARQSGGSGQFIDLSLYDSQVAWLANQNMNYLVSGEAPVRQGSAHPNIVPYQAFATADGHLMLAVGNDRQFASCMQCLKYAELASDPRFSSNADRVRNRALLIPLLSERMGQRKTAHWLQAFAEHAVPAGPINDLSQVFGEPFAEERELVHEIPHPLAGTVATVANPVRFSATPVAYDRAPPLLGQHTDEVLMEVLNCSAERIQALRDAGAV